MFTPLEPTVHTICQYNFEKQASKIRDLRPDTLAQMMTMANVRPGSKLLVVEDVHGMVVSAATERMGGEFPHFSHVTEWTLIGIVSIDRSGGDFNNKRRRFTT